MLGPSEWKIGRHTFRWAPPDVLWVTLDGDNTLAECREMVGVYRTLGEVQPYFILADARNAGTMESEARRYMSEHLRHEWLLEVIFYNTRLVHRAMAQGLLIAAEFFHAEASPMRGRIHFVSTQVKAQALLAQLRSTGCEEKPEAGDAPMRAPGFGEPEPRERAVTPRRTSSGAQECRPTPGR